MQFDFTGNLSYCLAIRIFLYMLWLERYIL